jgi:hypothetical protein
VTIAFKLKDSLLLSGKAADRFDFSLEDDDDDFGMLGSVLTVEERDNILQNITREKILIFALACECIEIRAETNLQRAKPCRIQGDISGLLSKRRKRN